MPQVSREFGSGPAAVQLSLTTFLLGLADIGLLVLFRFVQGAGGAAGVVIGRAVVSDRVHGLVAARIFAVVAAVQGLGPVVAPLAGGLLAPVLGWRGIFGVLTAVTTIMAVGAALSVPESLPPRRRTAGSGAAMARSLVVVTADRSVLAPALAFAFGAMFAYIAASPFVIQGLLGFSTDWYSLIFAANAAGLAGSSAVSVRLVGRLGPHRLLAAGSVLLLVSTVGLVVVTAAVPLHCATGRVMVLPLLCVSSTAVGRVFGNATSLALAATGTRAGAGSASLGAIQTVVGGLAASLVGLGGDGTAVPMALTMAAFAVLTVAAVAVAARRRREGP